MKKIAFVGFDNLEADELTNVLVSGIQSQSFPDGDVDNAARFLVSVQDGKMSGDNSVLILCEALEDTTIARATRLTKIGVDVRTGYQGYNNGRTKGEIVEWISSGVWPQVQKPIDPLADLLAEDEEVEEQLPERTIPEVEEVEDVDPLDELLGENTLSAVTEYPDPDTYSQDVLEEDDELDLPQPQRATSPTSSSQIEDEGELDLPSPHRSATPHTPPQAPSLDMEEEDEIELPASHSTPPQRTLPPQPEVVEIPQDTFEEEEEDIQLPGRGASAQSRVPTSLDLEGEDEIDLPTLPPRRVVPPPPAAQDDTPDFSSFESIEEDDDIVSTNPVLAPKGTRKPRKTHQSEPSAYSMEPEEPVDEMISGTPPTPGAEPFTRGMSPEEKRRQSLATQIQREYGGGANSIIKGTAGATTFYITGSHGGSGKTTVSWTAANTVAQALRRAGDERPVFLVEADYRNSKLAQRLNLPQGKDSGRYAQFLDTLQTNRTHLKMAQQRISDMQLEVIQDCIHIEPESGLHVVACPYSIVSRQPRTLKYAIQRIVEYAESLGGYVFIDADTLTSDDLLDRNLASKAHHVVLVTDVSHIDDMRRAAHTLTTSPAANGIGVDRKRISVFFNRTTYDRYNERKDEALPYSVDGFLPRIEQLEEHWVGDVDGSQEFTKAVIHIAKFITGIEPIDELEPWKNREITVKTPKGLVSKLRLWRKKP